jgi:hypothetical protein
VVPPEGDLHWPPCCAGFFREGRKTGPNSRAQKKDYENEYKQKSEIKAQSRPEQLSTSTGNRPKINLELRRANRHWKPKNCWRCSAVKRRTFLNWPKWLASGFGFSSPTSNRRPSPRFGRAWLSLEQHPAGVWQHPCGTIPDERATYDPRKRYGSYFAADQKPA